LVEKEAAVNTHRLWNYTLPIVFLLAAVAAPAQETRPIQPPLTFEPNEGQVNAEARYLARGPQGTIFLTSHAIVIAERGGGKDRSLRMRFIHGESVEPAAEKPTGGIANYYLSNDPTRWIYGLPMYGQIRYRGIFPGIDAVFHGDGQNLEYDFELKPHSSPDQIAFAFEGADRILPGEDGGLDLFAGSSVWHLIAPRAFQQIAQARARIEASYAVSGENVISLRLGKFDASLPLIIDPVVQYANILTVNNEVNITGAQADAAGNLFIGGDTFAQDYPVVNGQGPKSSGTQQVYVTKLNPAGDTVLYSTFLAASSFSNSRALALDAQGNAYLAGIAGASDFPLTSTNLGTCTQFCNAGFVAKFNATGGLVYSTLLASGQVLPYSIAVDSNGNAAVAGGAFDNSLKTVNAYQSAYQGGLCTSCGGPFFAKLNSTGTDFIFSSYFGGPGSGAGPSLAKGIAFDATGNVILAGSATADPPLVQPWQYGDGDLFLAEFAPDGKTLLFSTRLGGSGDIQPAFWTMTGVAVGSDGVIYLAGNAGVPDFPFSLQAFALPQEPLGYLSSYGMYVLAVNPSLTGIKYSAYLGGGTVNAIVVDSANHVYLAGSQNAFPLSPLKPVNAVVSDLSSGGFVAELDPSGAPVSMTQFGGHYSAEIPTAIAVDANLNIYVAGSASVQNVFGPAQPDPVTVGKQFGLNTGFNYNSFFAKITPANAPQISMSLVAPALILRNAGSADLHISGIQFGGGLAKQWGNCGQTVPGGTSCVLTVTDANGNAAAGTVTIDSDASPASQTFTVTSPGGIQSGSGIGDIVWFQDVAFSYPPQLQGSRSNPVPLKIWNVGTANALITSVTGSGAVSETNDCGSLLPGASCTVQVAISPTTTSSSGSLQITYDDNTIGQQYSIYGLATPQPLLLSMSQINFATQQINGAMIPRTVNILNTSDSTIATPTASLAGDPAFAIAGNSCISPLGVHQSCAVAVQLVASKAGSFNGILTIGGSSQVTLTGQTQNNLLVQAAPTGLDFGSTGVGGNQTLPLTLTNIAASAFALSPITFSLPDYSETDNCQGQIQPGATCTVNIKFAPQQLALRRAAASVGVSISSLTTNVSVSGIGVQPFALQAAPGQSLSATVQSGGLAKYQLQAVAAAGITDTLQLSCTGAPQAASCSVQPGSPALTSGMASSFTVNVSTSSAVHAKASKSVYPLFAMLLVISLLSLTAKSAKCFLVIVGLLCVFGINGCGGGSINNTGPGNSSQTTPPGAYSLTITGTGGTGSQSIALTLIVN
jgi:hypothetical protein